MNIMNIFFRLHWYVSMQMDRLLYIHWFHRNLGSFLAIVRFVCRLCRTKYHSLDFRHTEWAMVDRRKRSSALSLAINIGLAFRSVDVERWYTKNIEDRVHKRVFLDWAEFWSMLNCFREENSVEDETRVLIHRNRFVPLKYSIVQRIWISNPWRIDYRRDENCNESVLNHSNELV